GADDLALGRRRAVSQRVGAVHSGVPRRDQFGDPGGVGGGPAFEEWAQDGEGFPGVGDDRETGVFGGVEGGHVDVDELDVRVGEEGARGGGEVAVPGADADDQVGFAGQGVGGGGTGGADRADRARVVVA